MIDIKRLGEGRSKAWNAVCRNYLADNDVVGLDRYSLEQLKAEAYSDAVLQTKGWEESVVVAASPAEAVASWVVCHSWNDGKRDAECREGNGRSGGFHYTEGSGCETFGASVFVKCKIISVDFGQNDSFARTKGIGEEGGSVNFVG